MIVPVRRSNIYKHFIKMGEKKNEKKTYFKERADSIYVARISSYINAGCHSSLLCLFSHFFFKNTQEDIEYVLNNTTQQYQSHMQFIEDGAISIRHNSLLGDFFQTDSCDADIAKEQLMYSMELFADRNQVNQQLPFVTSVYLFNNWDQCIKEYYYAITLASEKQQEKSYTNMQRMVQER